MLPARDSLIDVNSGADARVQVIASTDGLLRGVSNLQSTQCSMQLVIDSKHRVLTNNYPVTVIGVLDAAQQFQLITLAVSNKESEDVFYDLLQSVKRSLSRLNVEKHFSCTISDNSDAIQKALRRSFPSATIGNCLFHLQQNIKKKRGLWNAIVPVGIPAGQRSKWTIHCREASEAFARHSIQWISGLHLSHDFNLCSELFLACLEAQGDCKMASTLRREYFSEQKWGWARCVLPMGCAGTNNSLEAFNGNVLARDVVAGTRMTMTQFFVRLDGVFRSHSSSLGQSSPPFTPLD
jgi:MULE transposase domain